MTGRMSCRLALALLEWGVGNEPLKGDLIEELHRGRSRWWLWRQVAAAIVLRPMSPPTCQQRSPEMRVLGAAVLVLLSFEAVFVVNVFYRLVFGPPPPNISGYAYLLRDGLPPPASLDLPALGWLAVPFCGFLAAVPVGWMIGWLHRRRYAMSLAFVAASVMACAVLTLQAPFVIQFVTMLVFVTGILVAGARGRDGVVVHNQHQLVLR